MDACGWLLLRIVLSEAKPHQGPLTDCVLPKKNTERAGAQWGLEVMSLPGLRCHWGCRGDGTCLDPRLEGAGLDAFG